MGGAVIREVIRSIREVREHVRVRVRGWVRARRVRGGRCVAEERRIYVGIVGGCGAT